ncbi:MAG TPA: hypothetical protein VGC90_03065, partial [Candidatus Limnocylindrales bacterium]
MTQPDRRLAPVVRLAPAKINLTLAVIGRRGDGFHDLHSVVVPLALADRLSVAIRASGGDSLHVAGFDAGPVGDNLVLRAIAATRWEVARSWPGAPAEPPPLAARLEKVIPVAAGLGGGSSDAAAAIDAAAEAWGAELEPAARLGIAAGLGSDVPLFLGGGIVLMEGRGERVTPLAPIRGDGVGILLVTPGFPVATADVFAVFAGSGASGSGSTRLTSEHIATEIRGGLRSVDLLARAGVLAVANDLAPAAGAVAPDLVAFRRAITRAVRRPVGLTGSGPTLWVLYPSLDAAAAAAGELGSGIDAGTVLPPGSPMPFIVATTLAPAAIAVAS